MSRRPHTKSRNGCAECKRRHMRCDGIHPVCINCNRAEIRCSYLDKNEPQIVPVTFAPQPKVVNCSAASTPSTLWSPSEVLSKQEPVDPYDVNLMHMELFHNLHSKGFQSMEILGDAHIPTSFYIKNGLTNIYLMHQLLAVSAFHLSTARTDARHHYRELSVGLQNRALSLFNKCHPVLELTPENCVHMFLFSSLIGTHVICDAIHYDRDSIEAFIDSFTNGLRLYRSVESILDECGDHLRESELKPYLEKSNTLLRSKVAPGSECDALQAMINKADIMDSAREAYRLAILHLQRIYDLQPSNPKTSVQISMILVWPVLVPAQFVDLLRQRQAEALVICAHYAVLLHRGRHLWVIGDGGKFVIEVIRDNLGPEWQNVMELPNTALLEGSVL